MEKRDLLGYARSKTTLPLCTFYEEAFEGHVPLKKKKEQLRKETGSNRSEGHHQDEEVLFNIDSHATG